MSVLTTTPGGILDNFADVIEGGTAYRTADYAEQATTLASTLALLNANRTAYTAHNTNSGGDYHITASVNPLTLPVAIDLGTGIALGYDLRTQYEAHRESTGGSGSHSAADATNAITITGAVTTLNELVALANDINTQLEAHLDGSEPHRELLVGVGEGYTPDDDALAHTITSVNATAWVNRSANNTRQGHLFGLTYAPPLDKYIGVGDGGEDAAPPYDPDLQGVAISESGASWSNVTVGKDIRLQRVRWIAELKKAIAVGSSDGVDAYLLDSTNATSWDERANPGDAYLRDVTYNPTTGRLLAVGYYLGGGAYIITSDDDGVTWVEQTHTVTEYLFGTVWADGFGLYYAVGANGTVAVSADGETWVEQVTSVTEALLCVAYSPDLVSLCACGGNDGTNPRIITQALGGDWTPRDNSLGEDLTDVLWSSTLRLYVTGGDDVDGGDANLLTSPTGAVWTEQATPVNRDIWGLAGRPPSDITNSTGLSSVSASTTTGDDAEYKGAPSARSSNDRLSTGNTATAGTVVTATIAGVTAAVAAQLVSVDCAPYYLLCTSQDSGSGNTGAARRIIAHDGVATFTVSPAFAETVAEGDVFAVVAGFKRARDDTDFESDDTLDPGGHDREFSIRFPPGNRVPWYGSGYETFETTMTVVLRILKRGRERSARQSVFENAMRLLVILPRYEHRGDYVQLVDALDTEPTIEEDSKKAVASINFRVQYRVDASYL